MVWRNMNPTSKTKIVSGLGLFFKKNRGPPSLEGDLYAFGLRLNATYATSMTAIMETIRAPRLKYIALLALLWSGSTTFTVVEALIPGLNS